MEPLNKIAEFFAPKLPETDSPDRSETPFDHTYIVDGREIKVIWETNLKTGEIYEVITPVKKSNMFQKFLKGDKNVWEKR